MSDKGDLILQKLSSNQTTMLGVLAGAIEVTILQPILYCKNTVQQGLKITIDPRVMYRGLSVSILNMGVATGLQFPITALVTKSLTGGIQRRLSNNELLFSSFAGGFLSGIVGGPLELVLIQQQRFGGNIIGTPLGLIKEFGVGILTRGMFLCSIREGLFCVGYLGITPILSRQFHEKYAVSENKSKVYASVIAGLIAAPLSHPFDTMKTGMQGDVQRKKYGTMIQTYNQMMSEGGFSRFFKGLFFRTTRMIMGIYIINDCKLRLAPKLFRI